MPFQAHDSERTLLHTWGRFRVKAPDISNPVPVQDEHVSFQNFGSEKGKIRESGNTGMGLYSLQFRLLTLTEWATFVLYTKLRKKLDSLWFCDMKICTEYGYSRK